MVLISCGLQQFTAADVERVFKPIEAQTGIQVVSNIGAMLRTCGIASASGNRFPGTAAGWEATDPAD